MLVDNPRDPNIVARMFVEAGKQAGSAREYRFQRPSQHGVGVYNVTQDKGSRFSSPHRFRQADRGQGEPAYPHETEVVDLDIEDDRATAVNVVRNGIAHKIIARGEIILSAGAIGSPRILLASGLGPANELAAAGVEVKRDIAGVGKNLRDHIDGMITCARQPQDARPVARQSAGDPREPAELTLLRRKGMLTTNYVEAGGFAKTRFSTGLPDIQFHFVPGYRSHRAPARRSMGMDLPCIPACSAEKHRRAHARRRRNAA